MNPLRIGFAIRTIAVLAGATAACVNPQDVETASRELADGVYACVHSAPRDPIDADLNRLWQEVLCSEGRWAGADSCTRVPREAFVPPSTRTTAVCLRSFVATWQASSKSTRLERTKTEMLRKLRELPGQRFPSKDGPIHRAYAVVVGLNVFLLLDQTVNTHFEPGACTRDEQGRLVCDYGRYDFPLQTDEDTAATRDPNYNCVGYVFSQSPLFRAPRLFYNDAQHILEQNMAVVIEADPRGDRMQYAMARGDIVLDAHVGDVVAFYKYDDAGELKPDPAHVALVEEEKGRRWLVGKESEDGITRIPLIGLSDLGTPIEEENRAQMIRLIGSFGAHLRLYRDKTVAVVDCSP